MTNYEKLEKVLTELFQLDKAELDFGIYRIMNQKRDDVLDFLKNKLPKEVRTILEGQQKGDAVALKKELDNAIKMAKEFDLDPNTTPKVQEARAAYESAGSIEGLEQEVFSHLASFFKRYYEGGDFISLRRYKQDVYAIPYEGEEVKLHWANHDQYYIKTSENLKNYAFKIDDDKTVKFTLKEASGEQNNNKVEKDHERRFALCEEDSVTIEGNTIHLNFTYELYKKSVKQEKLIEKAIEKLTDNVPSEFAKVFSLAPTDKNKSRTLLEKHLKDFSARNTFDYFIHKDLGGFLTRELDFYIKNEVLFIDDINTDSEQAFTTQLSKIRALKQVASKVITFLAQLENFQKKLWLKKKFVVSNDYCITLDRIPESYYTEIIANTTQLEEWKVLFDVDMKKQEDLNEEPYLVLDTKFFEQEFKDKLLAEFDDLDEETDGVLINSDNFQALNLLNERFKNKIQNIYIDPPYNTGDDGFVYKDNYRHSSWLSMIKDRLSIAHSMLDSQGSLMVQINDKEYTNLSKTLDSIFNTKNRVQSITVKTATPAGFKVVNPGPVDVSESILYYVKNKKEFEFTKIFIESGYVSDYNKVIVDDSLPYDKWEIIKIKDAVISKLGFKSQKEVDKKYGKEVAKTFLTQMISIYALENANRVFATYGPHKPAGRLKELIAISKENRDVVVYEEREGKTPFILLNGRLFAFYSNKLKNIDGKDVPTELLTDFWTDLSWDSLSFEGKVEFKNGKKPEKLIDRIIKMNKPSKGKYILDFFAGSCTTQASAQKLNTKWIGVEMGEYFGSKGLLRLKYVLNGEQGGISKQSNHKGGGLFKYSLFESYEDCLNNLQLKPNQAQQKLLDTNSGMQEEYLLQYMLDVETRDQLLNIEAFKNPFNYKLNITENNELVPTNVDLVETFNYLIGLHLKRVQRIGAFKTVEGVTNAGDKVLVIWRNLEESNNDDLNAFVKKMDYNLRDGEFDTLYVNGDNNLANLKQEDENWKVLLLEEVFFTLMFDVKDV